MASPAQADIVRELYGRRDSLDPDKRAVVEELYGRLNAKPIGEQTLSLSGLGQTMLETGKGAAKGLARDIYGSLEGAGPLGMAAHFAAEKTGVGNKIRQATESSNTSQKIGNYGETALTLAPLAGELGGAALERFAAKPPVPVGRGPYFGEGNTYGTTRGPSGPPPPGAPATGTVNVPPQANPSGLTSSPAGRIQAQPARPLQNPFTGTVSQGGTIPGEIQVPGRGQPPSSEAPANLSAPPGVDAKAFAQLPPEFQNAVVEGAAKRATSVRPPPATQPIVNGRPVILQEDGKPLAYADEPTATAATSGQPLKPSPVNGLAKPISATSAPSYTQQQLEQIAAKAKGEGADLSHQNAYHVGDVSEHKALNVARHLNDEGISANDYATMLKDAKDSGDWSAIDKINDAAYASAKAGGYQGYLPKNGYSSVSAARRVERSSYQGTSTADRILEHLREYDKFRK